MTTRRTTQQAAAPAVDPEPETQNTGGVENEPTDNPVDAAVKETEQMTEPERTNDEILADLEIELIRLQTEMQSADVDNFNRLLPVYSGTLTSRNTLRFQVNDSEVLEIKSGIIETLLVAVAALQALGHPEIFNVVFQLTGTGDSQVKDLAINFSASKSARKPREKKSNGATAGGSTNGSTATRSQTFTNGTETMSTREFVDKYADESDRGHSYFIKWPSRVAEWIIERSGAPGYVKTT